MTRPQTTNFCDQLRKYSDPRRRSLVSSKKPQDLHSKRLHRLHSLQLRFLSLLLVVLFFNRNIILPLLSKGNLSLNQVTKSMVSIIVLLLQMFTLSFSEIMNITCTIKILSRCKLQLHQWINVIWSSLETTYVQTRMISKALKSFSYVLEALNHLWFSQAVKIIIP